MITMTDKFIHLLYFLFLMYSSLIWGLGFFFLIYINTVFFFCVFYSVWKIFVFNSTIWKSISNLSAIKNFFALFCVNFALHCFQWGFKFSSCNFNFLISFTFLFTLYYYLFTLASFVMIFAPFFIKVFLHCNENIKEFSSTVCLSSDRLFQMMFFWVFRMIPFSLSLLFISLLPTFPGSTVLFISFILSSLTLYLLSACCS